MKQVVIEEGLFEGAVSFEKGDGWIKPWRLPFDKLRLFPPEDGMVSNGEIPAGVRLRFQSDSATIALAVVAGGEQRKFDLTIDGRLIQTATVEAGGELANFDNLPGGEKVVELWLPHDQPAALRHLLINPDSTLQTIADGRPKWVTYGSSITHCGAAHSPARTWPAVAARKHNLNLTGLGFGGNCHLDAMVARMIRDMPADFISLKVGINIQGGGSLSPRTFKSSVIGFVQIVREKHPDTPLAMISPIISPERETQPGPGGLSLQMMREDIEDAVSRLRDCGDENIHYFNGLDIFGEDLVERYLPDLVHPDGDGYEILGENFAKVVLEKISIRSAK